MLKAHEFGHFGINPIVERIKKHYYWKSIQKDVTYMIERCLTCLRNTTFKPFSSEAKALEVGEIFDRISIDLVGGLSTTNNGFNKICVIIDNLSKFVQIYPMRTKTEEETAEKIWNWKSNMSWDKWVPLVQYAYNIKIFGTWFYPF